MNKNFKPLFVILILAIVAKIVGVGLYIYLPKEGVILEKKVSFTPEYIKVKLAKLFGIKKYKKSTITPQKSDIRASYSINDLLLKGLYGNSKKGFVIVAKKSNPKKTSIISINEEFNGYKLKSIGIDYAIFEKNHKDYKLNLEKTKDISSKKNVSISYPVEDENHYKVDKKDVKFYIQNPAKIWKDISIKPVPKDGVYRFKIYRVKKDSKLYDLGLRKGDIILSVNNMEIKSTKDAFKVFSKFKDLRTKDLNIVILRDDEEREINYEIY